MTSSPTDEASAPPESSYWFARHSKSVIFLILTLALLGGYLAFTIPVAVFPATNFPRILIAVDNGVMPIDQMMVTITRRLEEACQQCSRTAGGALDHQPRLGRNRSVFRLERGHVPDAAIRERGDFAGAARTAAHGHRGRKPPDLRQFSHHRLQPYVGHRSADPALGDGDLRHQAATQPAGRRLHGAGAGRAGAGVSYQARPREIADRKCNRHRHSGHDAAHQPHRFAWTARAQSPTGAWTGQRAGAHPAADREHRDQEHSCRHSGAHRRRGDRRTGGQAAFTRL